MRISRETGYIGVWGNETRFGGTGRREGRVGVPELQSLFSSLCCLHYTFFRHKLNRPSFFPRIFFYR